MTKLMDVNPSRREGEMPESYEGEEMQKESRWKKLKPRSGAGWFALVLALLLLWAAGASYGWVPSASLWGVDRTSYQAVFLTNGQVYFGKLKKASRDYLTLEDIYYLQVSQRLQPAEGEPETDITLVKLGNELHGPEDAMYITKDQVIFWENMKREAPVVQAIEQVKAQQ